MSRWIVVCAAALALAPALRAQCLTACASVDAGGAHANGASGSGSPNVSRNFLSADGRYVAFWSAASNLVPADFNSRGDVFVKDRVTGALERVSRPSSGVEANGDSSDPALSADGRFVAFQSAASNLVDNDTNGKIDVFVHDRASATTLRASVSTGLVEGDEDATRADISADARFVVFQSASAALVAGDTNGTFDVFVRDLAANVTNRLSVGSGGFEAGGASLGPSISASGRFVAFHSLATNLVPGDTNGQADVFVRDRGTFTTTRVSVDDSGDQANYGSQYPSISADGRFVAFSSFASNLIAGDTNAVFDVFLKDRLTSAVERVSVSQSGGQGNSTSQGSSISADGRFVGFLSAANNLVPGDTNGGAVLVALDVFVRDRLLPGTERLSVDSAGIEAVGGESFNACVARDGSSVAFYSHATNLVPNDTNAATDVFVRSCGTAPEPSAYCAGDGTATACPCANAGQPGRGCDNSFATGGGRLDGGGASSVSSDTLTLFAFGLPPTTTALLFQGDQPANLGDGLQFGDGLRCVAGSVLRLGTRPTSAGVVDFGYGVSGELPISVRGLVPPGTISLRHYQLWYRNAAAFCAPEGFNLTNALTVVWIP